MQTLKEAVTLNDINKVKELVSQSDLSKTDSYGRTLLFEAVLNKNYPITQELIKAGMDINHKDKTGKTALHFAIQEKTTEIAKLLIESGAEVNSTDNLGNSVICDAVFNASGDYSLITYLLKKGADPDIKNNYGMSARTLAETIAGFDPKIFTV